MNANESLPAVLTFREAAAAVGRSHILTMFRSHRWQRPCRGIYVTHNGPITPEQWDLIALKVCAPGSALAGLSALRYDGFKGFEALKPVTVQPMSSSIPPHDNVVPHWSKWLGDEDVHPRREPRRTRPGRSLVDAASWASSDPQARVIVIAGVQQGLATTRTLREALTRRGKCKRRALIVESILDAHGGIQSLPERDFRTIWRSFGLPPPSHQSVCKAPSGRYYLDVEWKEYDIAVEVHGIPHQRIRLWDNDLLRNNEVVIRGKHQLIFSSYAIRHEASRVGDQLVRMLRSRGWNPDPTIEVVSA